jgi:prepilin-type N-terminal cleavage/methylation domain-containing protein
MKKGFTLIELLVVIAIIGILSGVVLTSLGSARTKSKDSRVISSLKEFRTSAELYREANGNYPTRALLFAKLDVLNLHRDVCAQQGISATNCGIPAGTFKNKTSGINTPSPSFTATNKITYCAFAWLPSSELGLYKTVCVDSTGALKQKTSNNSPCSVTSPTSPSHCY